MNPFEQVHADAWTSDFVDVPSLNARTSNALLECINSVRDGAAHRDHSRLRAKSVLVLGPAGSGKTHLFSRLREKCGPSAAFILMRPEVAAMPSARHVLAACFDALHRRVAGSVERQIDLVIGSALALVRGSGSRWPGVALDELRHASAPERTVALGQAIEKIEDMYPHVESSWLERFLELPFSEPTHRRAALAWLSGREPDASQLDRLGLKDALQDSSVIPALQTLAIVAAYSTPIVLVFDQLENLVDNDAHNDRVRAHANLVSELFDHVPGLVIVQMALDAEWERRIRPLLAESHRTRLEHRIETLELPSPEQREQLREVWMSRLPSELRPPAPWPFTAEAWNQWHRAPGVTPRMLMIACREAYTYPTEAIESAIADASIATDTAGDNESAARPDTSAPDLDDTLEDLWRAQQTQTRAAIDDSHESRRPVDEARLASGIVATLRLHDGVVVTVPAPSSAREALQVTGAHGAVQVFVIQAAHHRTVEAKLRRAIEACSEGRVVALREAAYAFPPTWKKVNERLEAFRATEGASWVEMPRADVVTLIAVHDLLSAARSQDLAGTDGRPLPEDVVRAWVTRKISTDPSSLDSVFTPPPRTDSRTKPDASSDDTRNEARPAAGARSPARKPAQVPPASARSGGTATAPYAARAHDVLVPRSAASIRAPDPVRHDARTATTREAAEILAPGPAMKALCRLRMASIERLVREVRMHDPAVIRSAVLAELRGAGSRVHWYGRSIVHWNEDVR